MPIRFKHGIEIDGGVTVDGQTLGSNAFSSATIPTHTSNLTNDSGFITQTAADQRYLRGVPQETGYNLQFLGCAIEMYDQATGGDLSWVVGADDRGGVGAAGQNAFVVRYGRGSRFNSNWRTQGTEAMTIDDSGRVGFAASVPDTRFEIRDNGFTNNRLRIRNAGGSGSHDASIELVNDDDGAGHAGGTWLARSWGWGNASLQLGGTTTGQWSGRYNISTTQKTYFENSGGVGIRVVPETTLDVAGEITGRGGDTGLIFKSRNTSATGAPDQFKIQHSNGNVNISNGRGDINFTTALKQGGNTVATQTWVTERGYAAGNHNHDGVYQPAGSYALANHNHDGVYQPAGSYAASNHNHDDRYITLSGKRDYILEWYLKGAYVYDSTNGSRYKFYKVGQLQGNGGEIILEVLIKHDVNYWDKAQSIISASTWNGTSISVQHDAIGAVSKPIRCVIDNDRNVYIAGGVEWDSYLSWRFIYKNNFTDTSSEDYVFLSDAIPAECVEIESGYSIRTNQATPVADNKFVSEDTIVGHLRTRGAVYTESHGTSANWKEAYDNYITGVSVTGTTTKTITLTQRDGGQISGTFTDTGNNTWRPIDDTPVDGATTESISSNWAYDHVNARNPHGTTAADVGAAPSEHGHDGTYLKTSGNQTMSGILTLTSTSDAQLTLRSSDTWSGIGFDDGDANGTDYIWHRGSTQTFAIGGGGSSVAGKKLHVHGGTTIGSGVAGTTVPANSLLVEEDVIINGGRLKLYNANHGAWDDGLMIDAATGWAATIYRRSDAPKMFTGLRDGTDNFIWMSPLYDNTGTTIEAPRTDAVLEVKADTDRVQFYLPVDFGQAIGTSRADITNTWVGNAIYFGGGNNYLNWTNSKIYTNVGFQSAGTIYANGGNSGQWNQAVGWGNHADAGYITYASQTRPAAPTTVTATVVGETIEIAFNQSATAAVDYYQVWAAQDSGSFSLIGQVPHTDFAATMTVVDAVFAVKGTRNYRVYAIRKGIYSDAATASRAFTSPTLEPANLNVVTMEEAFFVQWDAPNSRFVDHYEVWVHSAPDQGELNRDLATMTYSGTNTFYMYQAANNEFHQFWVEVIES